jgi:hypothetical protein
MAGEADASVLLVYICASGRCSRCTAKNL